jgi:hypothetical protein
MVYRKTFCQTVSGEAWFPGKLFVKPHLKGHGFWKTFCQAISGGTWFSGKLFVKPYLEGHGFWKTFCQTLTTDLWFSGKLFVKPHLEGHLSSPCLLIHGFQENFLSNHIWMGMVFNET